MQSRDLNTFKEDNLKDDQKKSINDFLDQYCLVNIGQ